MKGLKSTLVYFIVFVLIGGFYFLYTKKIEKKKEKQKELKKRIFTIQKQDISYISLKNSEKNIECLRKNGQWEIIPGNYSADKNEIEKLIENILTLKKERDLGENLKLEEYGLGQVKKEIIIGNPGIKFSLYIGETTPTETFYYATLDKKNIFLVSKWRVNDILDKKIFDLRDKRIIPVEIEKEKVEKVEIEKNGKKCTVQKEKNLWKITYPFNDLADKEKIEEILTGVIDNKVESFEEKTTLINSGLKNPIATLKIFTKGKEIALFFGKEKNGKIFAKNSETPYIFTINKEFFDNLPENFSDLREKDIFTFDRDSVIAMEIKNKNVEFSLIKKDDKWEIEGRKDKIENEKVEDFLDDLRYLEIKEFITPEEEKLKTYHLKNPEIKITVILPENRKETIATGKKKGNRIYCFLPHRNIITTISEEDYKKLNKKPDDFIRKENK